MKTLIFVIGMMILMSMIMYALSSMTLQQGIEIYETDKMQKKASDFEDLLLDAKNNLSQVAVSWSAWDEMCDFAKNGDRKFVEKNFQSNTFQMISADFVAVFNPETGIVYAESYDSNTNKKTDLDIRNMPLLEDREWYMYKYLNTKDVKCSLVNASGDMYLVAVSPIVNVQYEGPIYGSLIIGRKIDDRLKKKWMTKLDITSLEIVIKKNESDFGWSEMSMNQVIFTSKDMMQYNCLIKDNKQLICVKMQAERLINAKFESVIMFLLSWFVVIGLFFVLLMICFLEYVLFWDIAKTRKDIESLMGGRTKRPTGRLSITGGREFTVLRESINLLLDEILAYKKKEQIYKIIIDNMSDVVWVLDLNLNCLYVSQSIQRMQGWSVEERMAMSLREVVPDDSFEYLMKEFNGYMNQLSSGKDITKKFPIILRFQHYRKDRTIFWVEVIINLMFDDNGRIVSFQGLERDITDRIIAEDKIRDSEEKFKTITNCALDGIAMIDEKGNLLVWNKAAANMFGFSWEDIRNKYIHDYIAADENQDLIADSLKKFANNGQGNILGKVIEVIGKRKNGEMFPVELSVASVKYNNQWCAIAVMRDISDRKKAQKELMNSEFRYRKLIDMIPDGVGIVVDEKVVLSNKSNLQILGYEKEEDLLGKNILSMFPDEIKGLVSEGMKKVLAGKQIKNKEFKIIRNDRKIIDIDVFVTSIDYDGNNSLLCIFRDISEKKKSEKEKARLEQELKQRSKMETVGTLAGGIAHDFNNILAAIMGYLELLKDSLETPNDQDFDKLAAVNRMLKVSKRAADLVKQILTVCRKNIPNRQALELSSLVKEVIKLIKVTMPAGVTLVEHFDSSSFVLMDPVEMQQVILNLFSNASYAMKDKEGTINFTLSDQFINEEEARLYMVQPGKYVSMEVKDQGVGIENEIIDRVFEPFFTTKPVGEGTGMGLAMVYSIVKSSEGIVRINSKIDEGTVVEILLPACNRENIFSRGDIELITGSGKIVVLDDEEWFLDVAKRMLQKMGYEVVIFNSSNEALQYLDADNSIDLIITDYKMPDISGLTFVDRLRKKGIEQPIILCTGFGECLTREKVVEVGVTDFISKPCSMPDLSILVHRLLTKK